jgi:hypothetical protein
VLLGLLLEQAGSFRNRFDDQVAVVPRRVFNAIGIGLEFLIAPGAVFSPGSARTKLPGTPLDTLDP